jgi:hypothetical protein
MTVVMSAMSMVKTGRVEEAIASGKKSVEQLKAAGGKNVRQFLAMTSTPIRLIVVFEAANQEELGKITDKYLANPEAQKLMGESLGDDGFLTGYVSESLIEV